MSSTPLALYIVRDMTLYSVDNEFFPTHQLKALFLYL